MLVVKIAQCGEKLSVVAHSAIVRLLLGYRQVAHMCCLEIPQERRVVAPVPTQGADRVDAQQGCGTVGASQAEAGACE